MPAYQKKGSLGARVKALDFLRTVCKPDGEGYASYEEGWSDKKVSRHLRLGLTPKLIGELRREYIGKSRVHFDRWEKQRAATPRHPSTAATPITSGATTRDIVIDARLIQIEAKLDALLAALGLDAAQHD